MPTVRFAVDAPEVHVTRRVYRSGEGEYLINNQPVRLKDVKDLIRGTGIGIDAYSLIEQGKVDRMLQANAKDRRAIFEEAAGISRFKAKKVEAETTTRPSSSQPDAIGRHRRRSRIAVEKHPQSGQQGRTLSPGQRSHEGRCAPSSPGPIGGSLSAELESCESDLAGAIAKHQELETLRSTMSQERQAADLQLQKIADEARAVEEQRGQWLQKIAEFAGRRSADIAAIDDLRTSVAKSLRRVRLLQTQAGSAAAELRNATERLKAYQDELEQVRQQAPTWKPNATEFSWK